MSVKPLEVCLYVTCLLAVMTSAVHYKYKAVQYEKLATERLHTIDEQQSALADSNKRIGELQEQLNATVPPSPHIGNYSTVQPYDIALSEELQAYTYAMCKYYEIPEHYELVLAVMQCESNFVATAKSKTSDYGLMQINQCNLQWLATNLDIVDIMDPYQNIHAGVYFLSGFLKKYEPTKALMCYNLGEGGAKKLWAQGIESTKYSKRVLSVYQEYIR